MLLDKQQLRIVSGKEKSNDLSITEILSLAHFIRYHYKQHLLELIDVYSQLDAWYGMAMAVKQFNLSFPDFIDSDKPVLKAKQLFHIL